MSVRGSDTPMRAVSGAMYSGVPNTTPCWVTRPSLASGSRTLATPKSRIFTKSNPFSRSLIVCSPCSSVNWRISSRRPSRGVSMMFSGLRSRCTIPFACAAPSAPAAWFTIVIARKRSRRRSRDSTASSGSPCSNSITKNTVPSFDLPKSVTSTMFG